PPSITSPTSTCHARRAHLRARTLATTSSLTLSLAARLRPPITTVFPYTTLFRSHTVLRKRETLTLLQIQTLKDYKLLKCHSMWKDRKSTRLNSSHVSISYAVFCLKKKIEAQKDNRIRLDIDDARIDYQ